MAKNNRPISLLPVLSKVLERVAHEQFSHFLASNNMLSVHQSGNKRLHSTETLGILFNDHLYKAIDEGKVTAVLMLDLSNAFDSLDHTLLLSKFCKLGVADNALRWFTSYLTDRQQRVRIYDASVVNANHHTAWCPTGLHTRATTLQLVHQRFAIHL